MVASDYDGYRDTVADGRTGFLVPTLGLPDTDLWDVLAPLCYDSFTHLFLAQGQAVDVPATAAALKKLILDPGLRREMGLAGRARLEEGFSWSSVIARHLALWEALAARPVPDRESLARTRHPASMLFDPKTKKPLYRLAYDQVGASIALDVAREHGLPEEILERAGRYLLLDGPDAGLVFDRLNELALRRERELDAIRVQRTQEAQQVAKLKENLKKAQDTLIEEIRALARDVVQRHEAGRLGRKETQKALAEARKRLIDESIAITGEKSAAAPTGAGMDYPLEKVKKVLKIAKEPISLETPIGDEEDSSLGDFIEDKKALAPAEEVVNTKLGEQIGKVLSDLTPREEQVLRKRFGLGEKSDHTLEEVGKLFNVTRERIRQIEAKALRKLRHPVRSQHLRSYYEG